MEAIKKLRSETGLSIGDCKKAVDSTNGNYEEALLWLRKNGMKRQKKVVGRAAGEGSIAASRQSFPGQSDLERAALTELVCETDFVSRSDDFIAFQKSITDEGLLTVEAANQRADLTDLVAKLAENIHFRNIAAIEAPQTATYIHNGSKIGAIVGFSSKLSEEVANDIAMHIAAALPRFISKENVSQSEIDTEKNLAADKLNPKVPEEKKQMILEGQMKKFFSEICLEEQGFIKDSKKLIKDILKENNTSIVDFKRFQVGK